MKLVRAWNYSKTARNALWLQWRLGFLLNLSGNCTFWFHQLFSGIGEFDGAVAMIVVGGLRATTPPLASVTFSNAGIPLMTDVQMLFEIREQELPVPGWIVVAHWPSSDQEQLVGVYTRREFAEAWIRHQSAIWLEQRNAELE